MRRRSSRSSVDIGAMNRKNQERLRMAETVQSLEGLSPRSSRRRLNTEAQARVPETRQAGRAPTPNRQAQERRRPRLDQAGLRQNRRSTTRPGRSLLRPSGVAHADPAAAGDGKSSGTTSGSPICRLPMVRTDIHLCGLPRVVDVLFTEVLARVLRPRVRRRGLILSDRRLIHGKLLPGASISDPASSDPCQLECVVPADAARLRNS